MTYLSHSPELLVSVVVLKLQLIWVLLYSQYPQLLSGLSWMYLNHYNKTRYHWLKQGVIALHLLIKWFLKTPKIWSHVCGSWLICVYATAAIATQSSLLKQCVNYSSTSCLLNLCVFVTNCWLGQPMDCTAQSMDACFAQEFAWSYKMKGTMEHRFRQSMNTYKLEESIIVTIIMVL